MAGIFSQGGSAGHRYAGWLETVEAKNFQFGGKVFNGSPSAIYVGSNLVWMGGWLKPATRQAIMDAFLDDGTAVINATNAYLNQLAASDRDKATALAGFINEDPMMVCSLGLQPQGVTMPIRWLVGDGNSWIDTGIKPASSVHIIAKMFPIYHSDYDCLFGSRYSSSSKRLDFILSPEADTMAWVSSLRVPRGTFDYNTEVIYEYVNGTIKVAGLETTNSYPPDGSINLYLFCNNTNGTLSQKSKSGLIEFNLEQSSNTYKFVPFVSQTRNGMVDLETMTFHPNQGTGTFGVGYTLQDGVTPWTPSTH